ncbi:MAG: imidazoleglycerol-phosphate dehydratase HisB [Sulfurovum sp.]|nr:imidazoleglycerol-phosphate dehydratase HisB [Sulfurovum sp.]MCB4744644.1 imidazoleglycerol-phosphate dehydratase HisB [Sulfurovum sp.]MCB4745807.1 imidazoleglycerol-phosphate dehydratase HisB [Sulfurovum sp.]MCB4747953.1 imidazoleglycerol-phosphate dehydratase HisB [Sulfurovum sp.]MCB4749105.1 imidazoleglycerol-phosphate dehydratase HisB [Sulfurovum sp.]
MIEKRRETKETQISVKVNLYGKGRAKIDTGIGFFDHMLEAFTKHAHIDMEVKCNGDIHIDDHHTVEDVGIVIAQALREVIYPVKSIERFGNATVVMDEASITCDIDLSNRGFLVFELPIGGKVGTFDVELVEEFFRAFTSNLSLTLHLIYNRGKNKHHIIEASFKALAVALRRAVAINENSGIPSTKGVL